MKKLKYKRIYWIDAFELCCWRRLLDSKEIKSVNPKGNRPWIFIGRTDAEAETPVLWPPDAESWLVGKTLVLGEIEGGMRKVQQKLRRSDGITEWMGMSLSKLRGVGDGQGSLACCSWWGCKESDLTERLNWRKNSFILLLFLRFHLPFLK